MIHHICKEDWFSWREILADIVEILSDKVLSALVIILSVIVGLFVWLAEGVQWVRGRLKTVLYDDSP